MKRALLLVALCALPGCKTLSALGFGGSDDNPNVAYAEDADTNLKLGEEAFGNKAWPEASKYFEYVRTKFPYLEASKTAELRLGDTDFAREKYAEARERYLGFIKLHPTHPRIDYAAFRGALTYYKAVPSDFFIFPPSVEKDQVELRGAMNALKDFLRQYPQSGHKAEAEQVYLEVRTRLAKHELYVADFYRSRDRWQAVVGRLSVVERDFPDTGFEEKVYFGLAEAYERLDEKDKAKEALRTLVQRFPDSPAAKKARRALGQDG